MLSLESHPFPHIRHTISGTPSVAELAVALEYSLQHDELPILWDLRALEVDQDLWIYGTSVASSLVDQRRQRMSSKKRAFVVADAQAQAGIEMLLGRLVLPWPWAVFRDVDEALAWLERD